MPEKLSDLILLKSNSEAVSHYKDTRGPIQSKYTHEEIKNLISVEFENMEGYEELERRARNPNYEYVEDLFDRDSEDVDGETVEVAMHSVEDMIS